MDPDYFWYKLTPDELTAIIKAYHDSEAKTVHRSWEQVRELCFYMIVSFRGTGKHKAATDLMVFPWEEGYNEAVKKVTK